MSEPVRVSSQQLFARLDQVSKSALAWLNPGALVVYKPRNATDGAALRVQLRLEPTFSDQGRLRGATGGLFLDVVPQSGRDAFARFAWDQPLTAKLGLTDVSTILVGLRAQSSSGALPVSLQYKGDPNQLVLFHKFAAGSTVVQLTWQPDGLVVQVSKSRELRRSIKLALHEVLQLETYLQQVFKAMLLVGS
jgi:hypothetical protein